MTKSALLLLFSNILTSLLLQLVFLQSPHDVVAFRPTNETDRFALLALKDRISEDPLGVMDSWNESLHFCKWRGVSCSSRHEGRVTALDLASLKLVGSLPPHIGNLSFMREINLSQNYFKGEIPQEIGRLFRLRSLDLRINIFQGKIPNNLSSCSNLEYINFSFNELKGEIPIQIRNLLIGLHSLAIFGNQLTGGIPQWLGNASSLEVLSLGQNHLCGSIPDELGRLEKLKFLQLSGNNFEKFPLSIFNLSSLSVLSFADNKLHGRLPFGIGSTLPHLQTYYAGMNYFYGEIPSSLLNATKLEVLDIGYNNLSGVVPSNLGSLRNLQILRLGNNQLETAVGAGLEGLMTSLINCSNLEALQLNVNRFEGELPASIANLSTKLQVLMIGVNHISDDGNTPNLVLLNVSNNRLSGGIPNTLGNYLMLEQLRMDGSLFQGDIPPSLSSLKSLKLLDLSRNNLSGQIPKSFQNFTLLQYLNLSFNDLEGDLPTGGVFGNSCIVYVTGNPRLCGGIHQLGLPPCQIARGSKGKAKFHQLKIVISVTVSCFILLTLAILLVIFYYVRKSQRRKASTEEQAPEGFPRISYGELSKATDGFSASNLIGEGSFGSVYRGVLGGDGMSVAVKVMNLLQKGASKSFIAECEALRNVRHRNLIKIVTVCFGIDFKGTDFKALVYEFMQNGNLDKWLHPNDEENQVSVRSLSFIQRLNIAIDVACALEYLHDHCEPSIVHGDLKPSNILLDEDMVGHVGDFGLARFLSSSQTQSSSIGMKGTIGYLAPEYGMNRKASKPGDAYGFGILLLEMIIGKRPTDAIFKDGLTIHQLAKKNLPERLVDVLEPSLVQEVEDAENPRARNRGVSLREKLVDVVRIGVLCSMESPNERMEMKQAAAELSAIRDKFLGNRR